MQEEQESNSQDQLAQEEANIRTYLKTVPYEVLLAQRKTNKPGSSSKTTKPTKQEVKKQLAEQSLKKHDKNAYLLNKRRPVERSAKEHISRFKVVFEPKKVDLGVIQKKSVDPRYQNYAGKLDSDLAQKSYSFIPKLQERERDVLKRSLSNKKLDEHQKELLQRRYNQVTDSLKANEIRSVERQVEAQNKKHVAEGLKEGRQVFYKTKKIMKAEAQQRRMDTLEDTHRNRLMKDKQSKIESRMQWKGRHYARTANRNQ